jgi:hypothetical protein
MVNQISDGGGLLRVSFLHPEWFHRSSIEAKHLPARPPVTSRRISIIHSDLAAARYPGLLPETFSSPSS